MLFSADEEVADLRPSFPWVQLRTENGPSWPFSSAFLFHRLSFRARH